MPSEKRVATMKKGYQKLLILILFIAAFLRFFLIGKQSIWVDEMLTLSVSSPKPGLTIWDYLKYNIHGPFHSFIVYIFHFASTSDGWLRLPSALAGIGAIFFFYRWIKLWIGENTALLASALFSLNAMHIYYSQELRNYSFLLFFAMAANFYFHKLLRREKNSYYFCFILSTALAALSNFSAAFLFTAHSVIFFIHKGIKTKTILKWFVVGVCILVLISPWVYRIYKIIDVSKLVTPVMPGEITTTQRLRGGTTISLNAIPYAFYTFSVGFSLGPSLRFLHENPGLKNVLATYPLWIFFVFLGFGVSSVLGLLRALKERVFIKELALYLVLPFFFTFVLCWQNAKAFNARYVILSLPAFICIISLGILGIGRQTIRIAAVAVVVALSCISIGNYYFNPEYAREDVKGATRYMEGIMKPEDCILAPTVVEVVEHYLSGPRKVYSIYSPPGTPKPKIDKQLNRVLKSCASLWYIRARPWVDDPDSYVLNSLRDYYVKESARKFAGVKLIHFEK